MVTWGLRVCLCLSQQLYLQHGRGMNGTRDWVKSDIPSTTPKTNPTKTQPELNHMHRVRTCASFVTLFCCPELFLHGCSGRAEDSWVLRERSRPFPKCFSPFGFFLFSSFFSAFPSMCWKEQVCLLKSGLYRKPLPSKCA